MRIHYQTKISKILTDLKYEEKDTLNDIREPESKLEKLGLSCG